MIFCLFHVFVLYFMSHAFGLKFQFFFVKNVHNWSVFFLLFDQYKRPMRAQTENIKKQKLQGACKARPCWEISKPLPLQRNIFSLSSKCPLTVSSLSIRVLHRAPPWWELWPEPSRPRYSMAAVQTEQESWGKRRRGRKQKSLFAVEDM